MHWKGLRVGTVGANDPRRRSAIEPQSRHSEQLSRSTFPGFSPRRSGSPVRSTPQAQQDGDTDKDKGREDGPDTSKLAPSTPNLRKRFSFMKMRHASDPQLSKSYAKGEKHAPPVPNLPPRKLTVRSMD